MKTAIEKMYDYLKAHNPTTAVSIKDMTTEIGCSMAHISQTLKMAEMQKFLKRDIEGNLFVKKLPKKRSTFVTRISEESGRYRALVKGTGKPRAGRRALPKDFKIDEDTVVAVIHDLVLSKKELEEELKELRVKYRKALKYIKKLKEEKENEFSEEELMD